MASSLTSYYFGGEEGLWDAIVERWWSYEATSKPPTWPLAEQAKPFVPTTDEERATARLWPGRASAAQARSLVTPTWTPSASRSSYRRDLPRIVGSICQADPTTEEFTAAFAQQLGDVFRRLRPRT